MGIPCVENPNRRKRGRRSQKAKAGDNISASAPAPASVATSHAATSHGLVEQSYERVYETAPKRARIGHAAYSRASVPGVSFAGMPSSQAHYHPAHATALHQAGQALPGLTSDQFSRVTEAFRRGSRMPTPSYGGGPGFVGQRTWHPHVPQSGPPPGPWAAHPQHHLAHMHPGMHPGMHQPYSHAHTVSLGGGDVAARAPSVEGGSLTDGQGSMGGGGVGAGSLGTASVSHFLNRPGSQSTGAGPAAAPPPQLLPSRAGSRAPSPAPAPTPGAGTGVGQAARTSGPAVRARPTGGGLRRVPHDSEAHPMKRIMAKLLPLGPAYSLITTLLWESAGALLRGSGPTLTQLVQDKLPMLRRQLLPDSPAASAPAPAAGSRPRAGSTGSRRSGKGHGPAPSEAGPWRMPVGPPVNIRTRTPGVMSYDLTGALVPPLCLLSQPGVDALQDYCISVTLSSSPVPVVRSIVGVTPTGRVVPVFMFANAATRFVFGAQEEDLYTPQRMVGGTMHVVAPHLAGMRAAAGGAANRSGIMRYHFRGEYLHAKDGFASTCTPGASARLCRFQATESVTVEPLQHRLFGFMPAFVYTVFFTHIAPVEGREAWLTQPDCHTLFAQARAATRHILAGVREVQVGLKEGGGCMPPPTSRPGISPTGSSVTWLSSLTPSSGKQAGGGGGAPPSKSPATRPAPAPASSGSGSLRADLVQDADGDDSSDAPGRSATSDLDEVRPSGLSVSVSQAPKVAFSGSETPAGGKAATSTRAEAGAGDIGVPTPAHQTSRDKGVEADATPSHLQRQADDVRAERKGAARAPGGPTAGATAAASSAAARAFPQFESRGGGVPAFVIRSMLSSRFEEQGMVGTVTYNSAVLHSGVAPWRAASRLTVGPQGTPLRRQPAEPTAEDPSAQGREGGSGTASEGGGVPQVDAEPAPGPPVTPPPVAVGEEVSIEDLPLGCARDATSGRVFFVGPVDYTPNHEDAALARTGAFSARRGGSTDRLADLVDMGGGAAPPSAAASAGHALTGSTAPDAGVFDGFGGEGGGSGEPPLVMPLQLPLVGLPGVVVPAAPAPDFIASATPGRPSASPPPPGQLGGGGTGLPHHLAAPPSARRHPAPGTWQHPPGSAGSRGSGGGQEGVQGGASSSPPCPPPARATQGPAPGRETASPPHQP